MAALDQLDLALFGIGPVGAVPEAVRAGGPYFEPEQLELVRSQGAVSAVNLRFIDATGCPVPSALDQLVVGATLEQLRKAGRSVALAGGLSKLAAIRATLLGGWANVLVTDAGTAERLLSDELAPVG